jgi:hypothetical protein
MKLSPPGEAQLIKFEEPPIKCSSNQPVKIIKETHKVEMVRVRTPTPQSLRDLQMYKYEVKPEVVMKKPTKEIFVPNIRTMGRSKAIRSACFEKTGKVQKPTLSHTKISLSHATNSKKQMISQTNNVSEPKKHRVKKKVRVEIGGEDKSSDESENDSDDDLKDENPEEDNFDCRQPSPLTTGTITLLGCSSSSLASTTAGSVVSTAPRTPQKLSKKMKLTQLTDSQLRLFAKTTGAFRGPSDAYALFLTSGRTASALAKKALHSKLRTIDAGGHDEKLVEKSHVNKLTVASKNPRMLERLRNNHKETLRTENTRKTKLLDELRMSIITAMKSLTMLISMLNQLTIENAQIKDFHAKMTLELV